MHLIILICTLTIVYYIHRVTGLLYKSVLLFAMLYLQQCKMLVCHIFIYLIVLICALTILYDMHLVTGLPYISVLLVAFTYLHACNILGFLLFILYVPYYFIVSICTFTIVYFTHRVTGLLYTSVLLEALIYLQECNITFGFYIFDCRWTLYGWGGAKCITNHSFKKQNAHFFMFYLSKSVTVELFTELNNTTGFDFSLLLFNFQILDLLLHLGLGGKKIVLEQLINKVCVY